MNNNRFLLSLAIGTVIIPVLFALMLIGLVVLGKAASLDRPDVPVRKVQTLVVKP